jgi:hypothetical protein
MNTDKTKEPAGAKMNGKKQTKAHGEISFAVTV